MLNLAARRSGPYIQLLTLALTLSSCLFTSGLELSGEPRQRARTDFRRGSVAVRRFLSTLPLLRLRFVTRTPLDSKRRDFPARLSVHVYFG